MTAVGRRVPAWASNDTRGARVDDPVPAAALGDCPAVFGASSWPWYCTADAGHAGPHVAGGATTVHAVWTDDESWSS